MRSNIKSLLIITLLICIGVVSDTYVCATSSENPLPNIPSVEQVDEQPIIISTDKELPQSESRPDWLVMKEREIADEQAAANQSATLPQEPTPTPTQTAPRVPRTSSSSQSPEQNTEQTPATQPLQKTTNVAGVSSAVESKPVTEKRNPWLIYAVIAVVTALASLGAYRIFAYKTEYN